ncbi:hypothetical protein HNY73_000172 [Argiope bruennichi]|uniref:DUF5641 domain-containing protein n=1 Tax=Argiope bruennichi TaxID=94029 RepID=A0A8T0FZM3_ARGBR|nr:hypothetical protein HNY73_000172 [Argiope bruennichi]
MPHSAVVRTDKETTKVRMGFNASLKGKSCKSLNDCLTPGEPLNGTLDWEETPYPKRYDKDKQRSEKDEHEHSTRSEQNRERRWDGRERGINSRSRGGSSFVSNTDQSAVISGGSVRYESSRDHGGGNRFGAYEHLEHSNVHSGAAISSGVGAYRNKPSDNTSCSEVEVKLGHLRPKDEDSEVYVKLSLRKTLGKTTLSREELKALIIEIVGVLDSRPLTYVFSDFQEPVPLTPAHLLLGRRVNSLPPASLTIYTNLSSKKIVIKSFNYRGRLKNHFWKKRLKEYLLMLRSTHYVKPTDKVRGFKVDEIILIDGDKLPRQFWKLEKIVAVFPGKDGKVRSCQVKTNISVIKRNIKLLYNLEMDE